MKNFLVLFIVIFSITTVFSQPLEIYRISSKQAKFHSVCENSSQDYFLSGIEEQYQHQTKEFQGSANLLLMKVSNSGDTVTASYSRDGYTNYKPFVITSDNNEIIVMYVLGPCRDPLSPNYNADFLMSDTTNDKLVFAKIDDNLNLYDIKETFLDLKDNSGSFIYKPIIKNPNQTYTIMVMELQDFMWYTYYSLSFITLNSTGEIEVLKKYPIYDGNNPPPGYLRGPIYNLVPKMDQTGYLLMTRLQPTLHTLNLDFEITQSIIMEDFNNPFAQIYNNSVIHSQQTSAFYLSSLEAIGSPVSKYALTAKKIDENGHFIASFKEEFTDNDFWPAFTHAVDLINDDKIFLAGGLYPSPYNYVYYEHTYFVLYQLNQDLEQEYQYYYEFNETALQYLTAIKATSDGGCILLGEIYDGHNLPDSKHYDPIFIKYPAYSFNGIEEAQENGLKVAIAYPNPGNDKLCIRTAVPKAKVEIFDILGRLITQQNITETETVISSEKWNSGIYIWRVYSNGSVVETGKWIKNE